MKKAALRVLSIAWVFSVPAAHAADDSILFSATTAPNVVIMMDTSGSMREATYHPDYDPSAATCSYFDDDESFSSTQTDWSPWKNSAPNGCVDDRTIPVDPSNTQSVRWESDYLNWYFSSAADPVANEIATATVTFPCIDETVLAHGRSRITAGKHAVREVMCSTSQAIDLRYALARLRGDQGGYVTVGAADWNAVHELALTTAVDAMTGSGNTPLSETLFQLYTYLMSRDSSKTASGVVSGSYPDYDYSVTGSSSALLKLSDPVQNPCQRHVVLMLTDGRPTQDDFESNDGFAGWSNADDLIGNLDTGDGSLAIQNRLTDLAKAMSTRDMRPDLAGVQTVETFIIGFNTDDDTNALLSRTALMGNGEFHLATDPTSLTTALTDALTTIISRAQSFAGATIPASRTTSGNRIYLSNFLPSNQRPFWPGHIVKLDFDSLGEIRDADGDCALRDASGNASCAAGTLDPDANPHWDAAEEMPQPASRTLYVSTAGASSGSKPPLFDATTMTKTQFGVVDGDESNYPDSNANDADELAVELLWYLRGCSFGDNSCAVGRSATLGDIFHSGPLLLGSPNAPINQEHYREFARRYANRTRILYAGANDGFLHGFHASALDPGPPVVWTEGTGAEVMGFAPWQARQNMKQLPIDTPPRDFYFVDGEVTTADVRFYGSPQETEASKSWQQWHTVLIGGMRQGGTQYYALDVTNPDRTSEGSSGYPHYPAYLWEFPCEASTTACDAVRPYMAETWGTPIVTRVRVSVNDDGASHERWVAVVTGGYHPTGDPNDPANYTANALAGRAIYMIDVATGEVLAQKRFDPAIADPTDPEGQMDYAIASTPAVFDLNFDGFADVIYVGDLGGNLWKWVVNNVGGDPINGTGLGDDVSQPNWTFRRFFTAPSFTDSGTGMTWYKSFFHPPTGTLHKRKLVLAFGSGERANLAADFVTAEDGDNNRIYAMSDPDPFERAATPYATLTEGDLEDVTDKAGCYDASTYRGFYVVGRDGEKFVTRMRIFLGDLFAGSYIPTPNPDPCGTDGESFLYRLDLVCGNGTWDPAISEDTTPAGRRRLELGAGMPGSPSFSVGPTTDAGGGGGGGPCTNRVVVVTSDGTVRNECPGELDSAGVKIDTWRQRD